MTFQTFILDILLSFVTDIKIFCVLKLKKKVK